MGPRNAVLGGGTACGPCHWGLRRSSLWGHETLYWVWESHADTAIGAFGGAPYGATKRCTGWGNRMRTLLLGPSVELLVGPRKAVLGGGTACGHCHSGLRWSSLLGHEALYWACQSGAPPPCELRHWDLRWSSLWGHETLHWACQNGAGPPCELLHWDLRWSSPWGHETLHWACQSVAGPPCELRHWDLRWSSLWGHNTCEGCAKMGRRRHAGCATGTLDGAPYGATKHVRCVPKWGGAAMRAAPLGP